MENRRLLLAALLSAVVILAWQIAFPPAPPVRPEVAPPVETTAPPGEAPPAEAAEDPAAELAAGEAPAAAEESRLDFGAGEVAAEGEARYVLEAQGVRAVFTNRGAQLESLRLAEDLDDHGEPIEMVRRRGTDPLPYAIITGGNRSHRLNGGLFAVVEDVDEGGRPRLTFRHRSDKGAALKVFSLDEHGLVEATIALEGREEWGVLLGPGARELRPEELDNRFLVRQASYRRGGETETVAVGEPKEDVVVPASGLRWVALEDSFFLAAAIPEAGVREAVIRPIVQRRELRPAEPSFLPAGTELEEPADPAQLLLLVAGDGEVRFRTYLGAKQYRQLTALPYGLEETVHWGMFGFLVRPLYYGLEWFHENTVPNYGWAIVLVTLVIRILFFPLTHHSQKAMGKMQDLNPKLQAIRQKYRGKLKDKQGRPNAEAHRQMNEEVMGVYRGAGVNPASGCFPVLLQMPVFFAFYRLLSTAVELRNAPWILWVKDLASADPYYVLPILMGATSVAMQRMMPQPPDPMQRRVMQILPIVFTGFAFAFPSGLVLYWITNNILSMAQQALLVRGKKRAEAAAKAT